jgi:alanyl-tRNA synthetase/misacylated tRNA(Ala) deacylase
MELYAENSYIKECEVQIVSLNGGLVVFDRTIFYPDGGGNYSKMGLLRQPHLFC